MAQKPSNTANKGAEFEYTKDIATNDEIDKYNELLLKQNGNPKYTYVTDFWRNKYEKEASIYWDKFYKTNQTNFFKDRHYLNDEFCEITETSNNDNNITSNEKKIDNESESEQKKSFLEVGCGVGNALFPLMRDNSHLYFYAIDISQRAINFVKSNESYDESRCQAFVCDIVNNPLPKPIVDKKIDYALMLFVMSSIHPSHYVNVFYKLLKSLNSNGFLFFRDYARYDLAQLRFKPRSKLEDNFYVRDDGTRAYYFTIEELNDLMQKACEKLNEEQKSLEAGTKYQIKTVQNVYLKKTLQNKKQDVTMKRIWLQAKFQLVATHTS